MNAKIKIMIMAVVGFIATTMSTLEDINWLYILFATLGFIILYVAKNFVLPSNSDVGTVTWRDILSGILISISMAISSFAASLLTTGNVDWHALWVAVIGAVVGYFIKTIPQGNTANK